MVSLVGILFIYWGCNMMATYYDIDSPFCFFGGLLLMIVGFYILGDSLGMPRGGRAYG